MEIHDIVTGNFAPPRWIVSAPKSLRIVDWNIDRGQQLQGVTDFLVGVNADILILQEVDLNARRTHRLNIAETISRKLEMVDDQRAFLEILLGCGLQAGRQPTTALLQGFC